MPDISKLLFQLIDERGALAVASMLGHDDTAIILRWKKEGEIPRGKRWDVQEILIKEGHIK